MLFPGEELLAAGETLLGVHAAWSKELHLEPRKLHVSDSLTAEISSSTTGLLACMVRIWG